MQKEHNVHDLNVALSKLGLDATTIASRAEKSREVYEVKSEAPATFEEYNLARQFPEVQNAIQSENALLSSEGYDSALKRLGVLQSFTLRHPYNIALRLALSDQYEQLFYPDLAAGEAYKALLLIDELCDESGEYHELVFEATEESLASQGVYPIQQADVLANEDGMADGASPTLVPEWASTIFSEAAYQRLVKDLFDCGCVRSATEMAVRMLKKHPRLLHEDFTQSVLRDFAAWCEAEGLQVNFESSLDEAPDLGSARRELYPWNDHEPDRFSDEAVELLNTWMSEVAPQLEVKATQLPTLSEHASVYVDPTRTLACIVLHEGPCFVVTTQYVLTKSHDSPGMTTQFGVFAKEDLTPGTVVLNELSLLTASSRIHDAFCDACSAALPRATPRGTQSVVCGECDEAVFCSQTCLDAAQEAYHPALCERDVSALAKGVSSKESADALYSLLLLRALALSETADVHPLDLREVKYIWADYSPVEKTGVAKSAAGETQRGLARKLPFSFKYNILLPLNMAEKMDLNIFDNDGRLDTWVFNTLYAKFRGTASARQGVDGRPEVGAVHPLWCLANHSCDPGVTWVWEGQIQLRVKEEREQWNGTQPQDRKPAGVRKGEEVLNHYCDVRLDVRDRREWAIGALGGLCKCDRCQWEEEVEQQE